MTLQKRNGVSRWVLKNVYDTSMIKICLFLFGGFGLAMSALWLKSVIDPRAALAVQIVGYILVTFAGVAWAIALYEENRFKGDIKNKKQSSNSSP